MKTTIIIICDNRAPMGRSLIAEHGLSILIESDEIILYDTGQGLGLINNLKMLEKKISEINKVIISHGHYDHVGGLMNLLENYNNKLPVYLNPEAFKEKVACLDTPEGQETYSIGWLYEKKEYEDKGAVFKPVSGAEKISDKFYSFSNIKRKPGWKAWDTRLKKMDNNTIMDDPFEDDLSLLVETESGPVVILGCAHAGIIEILNEINDKTGYKEFHAVIGGTHLASAPYSYIEESINTLKRYNIKVIGASHCTGFDVASNFALIFKDKFISTAVGNVFEF